MKKKLFGVVALIVILSFTLGCICSCKEPFNYDWRKIDELTSEIGIEDNLYLSNGSVLLHGTKLDILYKKNEDVVKSYRLTRYADDVFSNSKYDYCLYFNIHYYNLVPDVIVESHFKWQFASTDPRDWCSVMASLSYYVNGEESMKIIDITRTIIYIICNLKTSNLKIANIAIFLSTTLTKNLSAI